MTVEKIIEELKKVEENIMMTENMINFYEEEGMMTEAIAEENELEYLHELKHILEIHRDEKCARIKEKIENINETETWYWKAGEWDLPYELKEERNALIEKYEELQKIC